MLKSFILRLFLFFSIVSIFCAGILYLQYQSNLELPLKPDADNIISVKRGDNIGIIAHALEKRGIIRHRWIAVVYARLHNKANKIKAGDYLISPEITLPELLQHMVDGKVVTYNFTVVEGTKFADVLKALAAEPNIRHTLAEKTPEQIAEELHIVGNPEGQFLPETYQFNRNTTDIALLGRMHRDMQQFLAQSWAGRAADLPLKMPYEALILASIIEKETALSSERNKISGVFIRRLRQGMPLQTDPAVIYGASDYHGVITRSQLQTDTPYNTYLHKGLPPTPIALPGKASIKAAVHPEAGTALYFVANGHGGHTFSDTYQEHLQAVNNYRQQQKKP